MGLLGKIFGNNNSAEIPPPEVPEEKEDSEEYTPNWRELGKQIETGEHSYGETAVPPKVRGWTEFDEAWTKNEAQKLNEGYREVQQKAEEAGRQERAKRGEPTETPEYNPPWAN